MGGMKDSLGETLFNYPARALARSSDPQTSHDAARLVKCDALQLKVLKCCGLPSRRESGSTKGEVWDYLLRDDPTIGNVDSIGPRFAPLHDFGFLEYRDGANGHPVRRKWSKGASQQVHWITAAGMRYLNEQRS
jgi:hypothetical protein